MLDSLFHSYLSWFGGAHEYRHIQYPQYFPLTLKSKRGTRRNETKKKVPCELRGCGNGIAGLVASIQENPPVQSMEDDGRNATESEEGLS